MTGLPVREGRVVDAADLMSSAFRTRLGERVEEFVTNTGHDAVIVTVPQSAPLEASEYAVALCEQWSLGGERRDGVMFFVSRDDARVECLVGPALTGALPDEVADRFLSDHVAPRFERGDPEAAILCGFELLARIFEHVEGMR